MSVTVPGWYWATPWKPEDASPVVVSVIRDDPALPWSVFNVRGETLGLEAYKSYDGPISPSGLETQTGNTRADLYQLLDEAGFDQGGGCRMKHTPGPWDTSEGLNEHGFECIEVNGVNGVGGVAMWLAKVQTVTPRTDDNWQETPPWASEKLRDECEANARLIAAAPELLEALQLALEAMKGDIYAKEARTKAYAAIAKATGGKA